MEDRIVMDPAVCNGRPTIRGTRITAQTVLELLGAGDSIEDVLEEYPTLTRDDVLACLRYSSRLTVCRPRLPSPGRLSRLHQRIPACLLTADLFHETALDQRAQQIHRTLTGNAER